jgi:dienelactone hydrolase
LTLLPAKILVEEICGERARLGRSFPRPRGKHRTRNLLATALNARARPATPGAGVLPQSRFFLREFFNAIQMSRMKSLGGSWLAFLFSISIFAAEPNPRADFLKLIERPRVPLAAQVEEISDTNGMAQFHFSFATETNQRVPGILLKPEHFKGQRPVVIALHGTGGTKSNMLTLCRKLAGRGFIAVAIDGRYHGERTKSGKGSAEYQDAIVRAWRGDGEHPLYFDTVWDVMRLVDYLKTRPDVNARRIGLIGISKGGIETYLAAAADTRIAVAVPCIGVQSFRWGLEHDAWRGRVGTVPQAFEAITNDAHTTANAALVKQFYDRVIPGIDSEFDGPTFLPLIAPRPLLVINGDSDVHTPLPGVMECVNAAKPAYKKRWHEDHFAVRIEEKAGHKVTADSERAAIDWFVKWLKP